MPENKNARPGANPGAGAVSCSTTRHGVCNTFSANESTINKAANTLIKRSRLRSILAARVAELAGLGGAP